MTPDGDVTAVAVVEAVQRFVARALTGVGKRIDDLQAKIAAFQVPRDGKDADMEQLKGWISREVELNVAKLPKPKDGESVHPDTIRVMVLAEGAKFMAALPKPKDGEKGKDGENGLGFDDLSVEFDGERTVTLKFQRGEVIKTFPIVFPVPIDRGVYREGAQYAKADGATWGGSWWIAQVDTGTKPDSGDGTWRLAVKRGRDGSDAKPLALVKQAGKK